MPRLEHIGIAVDDVNAVTSLYEALLGVRPYKTEGVEREGVRTHFVSTESAKLELLEALGPDSPVAKYLDKRGEGLHHLAFEVGDIHAQMRRLREAGFTPLSDDPRAGADGKLIFFLHPKQTHGVLVEFCQSVPTAFEPRSIPYKNGHLAAYELGDPANTSVLVVHDVGDAALLGAEPLVRRLEPQFHVLALDLAGHGRSDAFADHSFTLDFFVDNLRAALDVFDLDQAHLFGAGVGGYVALRFAQQHPGRVARLATHGTNVIWDDRAVEAAKTRLEADAVASGDPARAGALTDVHTDWTGLARRLADFLDTLPRHHDIEASLGQIGHPTLISDVDRTGVPSMEAALHLHRRLPNSALAVLPGDQSTLQALHLDAYVPLLKRHLLT